MWSIAFLAAIMTFPIQHGQIESWKYGHPQNHELEELMQNGIFFAGDEFDIKISFFHFTKWEYFFIKLNTNNSDLCVFLPLSVFFFSVPYKSNWWKTPKSSHIGCDK